MDDRTVSRVGDMWQMAGLAGSDDDGLIVHPPVPDRRAPAGTNDGAR